MANDGFEDLYPLIKHEIYKYDDQRVKISRPRILCLMFQENGKLITPRNLNYFRHPLLSEFPLDLNLGFEDYKQKNEEFHICESNKLEKYLMEHDGHSFLHSNQKHKIFTTRNVLKLLMMTPYRLAPSHCSSCNCCICSWNDWTLKAIKFQNLIYLIAERDDFPGSQPNINDAVDENKHISAIFDTTIDDFQLFYSGYMVGVESDHKIRDITNENTLNKCRFVATNVLTDKVYGEMETIWTKHWKFFRIWIQCYLSRIDKSYVGLRNENGFIYINLKQMDTHDLPKGQRWKPEVCKRFMRDFLKKVQEKMVNIDCPYTVYEYKFDLTNLMAKVRIHEGKTEHSFLSEEFIQYLQTK